MFRKVLSLFVLVSFFLTSLGPLPKAEANELGLPVPGSMVNLSAAFEPTLIKGLTVHKDNPFLFDFIVDTGHSKLEGDALKAESDRLIKYFFACLTIPEKDLWVNLSPYEKDRMVPKALGETALGRDLLAQDYLLKQLTASLIYPEKDLGKKFWDKVYAKAQQVYGTTEVPVNTFNKVWIVADKASVYEHNQTAFVVDGHMKVMLEEDYQALQKNGQKSDTKASNVSSQIVRDIILPEIENEVNSGKNFNLLRQILNAQILATWYKKNLKEALINQVYADQSTVNGVNTKDKGDKNKIYEQYLQAYKKGVFNFIKEEKTDAGKDIPRKYFSGGVLSKLNISKAMSAPANPTVGNNYAMTVALNINEALDKAALASDNAMTVTTDGSFATTFLGDSYSYDIQDVLSLIEVIEENIASEELQGDFEDLLLLSTYRTDIRRHKLADHILLDNWNATIGKLHQRKGHYISVNLNKDGLPALKEFIRKQKEKYTALFERNVAGAFLRLIEKVESQKHALLTGIQDFRKETSVKKFDVLYYKEWAQIIKKQAVLINTAGKSLADQNVAGLLIGQDGKIWVLSTHNNEAHDVTRTIVTTQIVDISRPSHKWALRIMFPASPVVGFGMLYALFQPDKVAHPIALATTAIALTIGMGYAGHIVARQLRNMQETVVVSKIPSTQLRDFIKEQGIVKQITFDQIRKLATPDGAMKVMSAGEIRDAADVMNMWLQDQEDELGGGMPYKVYFSRQSTSAILPADFDPREERGVMAHYVNPDLVKNLEQVAEYMVEQLVGYYSVRENKERLLKSLLRRLRVNGIDPKLPLSEKSVQIIDENNVAQKTVVIDGKKYVGTEILRNIRALRERLKTGEVFDSPLLKRPIFVVYAGDMHLAGPSEQALLMQIAPLAGFEYDAIYSGAGHTETWGIRFKDKRRSSALVPAEFNIWLDSLEARLNLPGKRQIVLSQKSDEAMSTELAQPSTLSLERKQQIIKDIIAYFSNPSIRRAKRKGRDGDSDFISTTLGKWYIEFPFANGGYTSAEQVFYEGLIDKIRKQFGLGEPLSLTMAKEFVHKFTLSFFEGDAFENSMDANRLRYSAFNFHLNTQSSLEKLAGRIKSWLEANRKDFAQITDLQSGSQILVSFEPGKKHLVTVFEDNVRIDGSIEIRQDKEPVSSVRLPQSRGEIRFTKGRTGFSIYRAAGPRSSKVTVKVDELDAAMTITDADINEEVVRILAANQLQDRLQNWKNEDPSHLRPNFNRLQDLIRKLEQSKEPKEEPALRSLLALKERLKTDLRVAKPGELPHRYKDFKRVENSIDIKAIESAWLEFKKALAETPRYLWANEFFLYPEGQPNRSDTEWKNELAKWYENTAIGTEGNALFKVVKQGNRARITLLIPQENIQESGERDSPSGEKPEDLLKALKEKYRGLRHNATYMEGGKLRFMLASLNQPPFTTPSAAMLTAQDAAVIERLKQHIKLFGSKEISKDDLNKLELGVLGRNLFYRVVYPPAPDDPYAQDRIIHGVTSVIAAFYDGAIIQPEVALKRSREHESTLHVIILNKPGIFKVYVIMSDAVTNISKVYSSYKRTEAEIKAIIGRSDFELLNLKQLRDFLFNEGGQDATAEFKEKIKKLNAKLKDVFAAGSMELTADNVNALLVYAYPTLRGIDLAAVRPPPTFFLKTADESRQIRSSAFDPAMTVEGVKKALIAVEERARKGESIDLKWLEQAQNFLEAEKNSKSSKEINSLLSRIDMLSQPKKTAHSGMAVTDDPGVNAEVISILTTNHLDAELAEWNKHDPNKVVPDFLKLQQLIEGMRSRNTRRQVEIAHPLLQLELLESRVIVKSRWLRNGEADSAMAKVTNEPIVTLTGGIKLAKETGPVIADILTQLEQMKVLEARGQTWPNTILAYEGPEKETVRLLLNDEGSPAKPLSMDPPPAGVWVEKKDIPALKTWLLGLQKDINNATGVATALFGAFDDKKTDEEMREGIKATDFTESKGVFHVFGARKIEMPSDFIYEFRNQIKDVVISLDRDVIFTRLENGEVQIWNEKTGLPLGVHNSLVTSFDKLLVNAQTGKNEGEEPLKELRALVKKVRFVGRPPEVFEKADKDFHSEIEPVVDMKGFEVTSEGVEQVWGNQLLLDRNAPASYVLAEITFSNGMEKTYWFIKSKDSLFFFEDSDEAMTVFGQAIKDIRKSFDTLQSLAEGIKSTSSTARFFKIYTRTYSDAGRKGGGVDLRSQAEQLRSSQLWMEQMIREISPNDDALLKAWQDFIIKMNNGAQTWWELFKNKRIDSAQVSKDVPLGGIDLNTELRRIPGLKARTIWFLKQHFVQSSPHTISPTMGDLTGMSFYELSKLPNFGPQTMDNIVSSLRQQERFLRDETAVDMGGQNLRAGDIVLIKDQKARLLSVQLKEISYILIDTETGSPQRIEQGGVADIQIDKTSLLADEAMTGISSLPLTFAALTGGIVGALKLWEANENRKTNAWNSIIENPDANQDDLVTAYLGLDINSRAYSKKYDYVKDPRLDPAHQEKLRSGLSNLKHLILGGSLDNPGRWATPGGIDLNPSNMGLSVSKDAQGGVTVTFDPALVERIRKEGVQSVVPVIINIVPISDIRPLLGLS
jgi:hypothetical protein